MKLQDRTLWFTVILTLGASACGDDGSDTGEQTSASSTGSTSTGGSTTDSSTSASSGTSGSTATSTSGESTESIGTDESSDGGSSTGIGESSDTGTSTGDARPESFIAGGAFMVLPSHEATDPRGFGLLIRRDSGTEVSLAVAGLTPNTDYPAHVHMQACDDGEGGGHYKLDPSIDEVVESNEIWPVFTTDAMGFGWSQITLEHVAREDAVSIIVHDPENEGSKMLCLDLQSSEPLDPFVTTGTAIVLEGAVDAGFDDLTASIQMERSLADGTTMVTLSATGLGSEQTYPVHVHNQDCSIGSGGTHYKIDPSVAETEEANEIWLPVTTDVTGEGTSEVTVSHLARADGMSLVIHDNDDSGTRLACIDLRP